MTGLFRRRANQSRHLAAAARNDNDKGFLVVVSGALEGGPATCHEKRKGDLDRRKQKHGPDCGG